MEFKPTPEQELIVKTSVETNDNLIINALAGAAKTSTLVLIAKALMPTSILCLAFNKRIAEEMKERLPPNCQSMTLNSLGHRVWGEAIGRRLQINPSKVGDIIKSMIEDLDPEDRKAAWEAFPDLIKTVSFGKACGYLPTGYRPDRGGKGLMDDEEFQTHVEERLSDLEWEIVRGATVRSLDMAWQGECDYDDQIYMPTIFGAIFPKFPLVLIDEAQDLSALNHATLRKLAKKRLIAVGDPCQPDGTLITRVLKPADRWNEAKLEEVPIENIIEGDKILGYNGEGAFLYNRKVEGIARKPYEGTLISVVGRGVRSRYTPNHHCYASFESLRNKHALYLMQRGSVFRIGICKMAYGDMGSGPIVRARHEDADAVWILETFDDQSSARLFEAFYQAEFGIPDLTFNEPSSQFDRGFLESFWGMAESLDLPDRAKKCLTYFGRMLEYPLWEKGLPYTSLKRPTVVRACNLMNGCKMLPYEGVSKISAKDWIEVDVGSEHYSGFVTSFTISDNHLYVADNLVTHNCQAIYGFRGAHEDSMQLLQQTFNMVQLNLTVSFRCPIKVVEHARFRAPTMQWPEWAKEGAVSHLGLWSVSDLPDHSVILCRNNAPLFSMAIKMLKNGRYPQLVGNDIGKGLLAIMKKFGDSRMPQAEALQKVSVWEEAKVEKSKNPGPIRDRAECMRIFLAQGRTLGDAIAYADHLFTSMGPIKLMTGHKSKGLEFDDVFILDRELLGAEGQERNLRYVMITRSKSTLTYIDSTDLLDETSPSPSA